MKSWIAADRVPVAIGRKTSLRLIRIVAFVALGFLLVVQIAEAGHYHAPREANHFLSASRAAAPDICPICLHHSNATPIIVNASPFVEPLSLVAALRLEPERSVALEIRFALFGRGPPATV